MGRSRWIAAASVAAGALLLAALAAFTPWRLLADRAATVPWPGWIAATLGMSLTYALRAGRLRVEWRRTLRALGLGYRECLQVTLLHNAAINLLPMRSGEASYAFLLHRRWKVRVADAAASLLWLRLQDMMVLGVLGIAILVPAPLPWRIGFAVAAIAAAAALLPALVRRVHVRARHARARTQARRARKAWHLLA
ncbi:MAG: lysylphosphatidylglycerol synthase domain-containing protein, partial [Burkholderiaceae bacterium]